jgi:hypothetical protein
MTSLRWTIQLAQIATHEHPINHAAQPTEGRRELDGRGDHGFDFPPHALLVPERVGYLFTAAPFRNGSIRKPAYHSQS